MCENMQLFIRCKGGRIGIWVELHVEMDKLYGESDVVARVYLTCIEGCMPGARRLRLEGREETHLCDSNSGQDTHAE